MSERRWHPPENRARIASRDREPVGVDIRPLPAALELAGEGDAGDRYLQGAQQATECARSAIEDLRVQQMTRSAAGTIENPGRCVKRKRGLNRSILRQGWGMARRMLQYKAAWRGVLLVPVEAAFTSQTCASCGHVDRANRRTRSSFECVACGHRDQADRNAAKNILTKALALLGQVTESPSSGCSASTAGHAGTHACGAGQLCQPRPRPAARGWNAATAAGCSLAGTVSESVASVDLRTAAEGTPTQ